MIGPFKLALSTAAALALLAVPGVAASPGAHTDATISGAIRDANGDPVANVCVGAWDSDVEFVTSTYTTDGTYQLWVPRPGDFRLRFDDCGGRGLGQVWYEDGASYNTATPVFTGPDPTVTGIDVVLDPGPMSNDYGTATGENRANEVDCGTSDGTETVGLDDIGGSDRTVRADVSESGDGYVVWCSGAEDPLPGRGYAQGNAAELEGSACGDGTAGNPYPFDQWACITDDRDSDGLPDVKCRGYDDSANSADPANDADTGSCLIPITG